MKKTLQILNGVAFVSVLFINYLSNTGAMNGKTIGSISDNIKSIFTPAGYAFSIWGIIYLLLLGFIVYQGRSLFVKEKNNDFILKIGPWFIISCVANSAWVFCWVYEYTGLSCLCIFILLFALLKIIMNNNMALWNAPKSTILFLWWPFLIYAGWVTVASVANVSSYLVKINWDGFGISPEIWTVIMIVIATIINIIVVFKRNMRAFALVGCWALIAIGVANKNSFENITLVAYSAAILLFVLISFHGFKNRKTNPFLKF